MTLRHAPKSYYNAAASHKWEIKTTLPRHQKPLDCVQIDAERRERPNVYAYKIYNENTLLIVIANKIWCVKIVMSVGSHTWTRSRLVNNSHGALRLHTLPGSLYYISTGNPYVFLRENLFLLPSHTIVSVRTRRNISRKSKFRIIHTHKATSTLYSIHHFTCTTCTLLCPLRDGSIYNFHSSLFYYHCFLFLFQ